MMHSISIALLLIVAVVACQEEGVEYLDIFLNRKGRLGDLIRRFNPQDDTQGGCPPPCECQKLNVQDLPPIPCSEIDIPKMMGTPQASCVPDNSKESEIIQMNISSNTCRCVNKGDHVSMQAAVETRPSGCTCQSPVDQKAPRDETMVLQTLVQKPEKPEALDPCCRQSDGIKMTSSVASCHESKSPCACRQGQQHWTVIGGSKVPSPSNCQNPAITVVYRSPGQGQTIPITMPDEKGPSISHPFPNNMHSCGGPKPDTREKCHPSFTVSHSHGPTGAQTMATANRPPFQVRLVHTKNQPF